MTAGRNHNPSFCRGFVLCFRSVRRSPPLVRDVDRLLRDLVLVLTEFFLLRNAHI